MKENKTNLLWADDKIYLAPPSESDIPHIVRLLQDKEIYDNTIKIPYPYTEQNGKEFIIYSRSKREKFRRMMEWGAFLGNNSLIGMVGFLGNAHDNEESEEVGYWIGKDYWNQGIMTKVLNKITEYGFNAYQLKFITLKVFTSNKASCRVAEKCGYKFQGFAPQSVQKDGHNIEVRLYVRENL